MCAPSILLNNLKLCSKVIMPMYTPTGSEQDITYSPFLPEIDAVKFFACQLNSCEILSPILINLFFITAEIEHPFLRLLTTYVSPFVKYLFVSLVHLSTGIHLIH